MNNPPVKICFACFGVMHSATKTCPFCAAPARKRDQLPMNPHAWPKFGGGR